MDFSLTAAALISSRGRAHSMSFFGALIDVLVPGCLVHGYAKGFSQQSIMTSGFFISGYLKPHSLLMSDDIFVAGCWAYPV